MLSRPWRQFFVSCASATVLMGQLGCRGCYDWCSFDILPGAIPQPIGTSVCQWQLAEMDRAELDDFVIYQREWRGDTATLDSDAEVRLAGLARRMLDGPQSVFIQPSSDPQLDSDRQALVVDQLLRWNVSDAGERVVLQPPAAEGMLGIEAPWITSQYLAPRGGGMRGQQAGLGGAQGSSGFGGGGFF
ncbi:MAG: hypothetical protein AB7F89_01650 [Pirellulaceae bacterium]